MERWRTSLVLLLSIVAAVTVVAYGGHTTFSPAAWRQAPNSYSPFWSRKGLLEQLAAKTMFLGLERERVIALLGSPGKAVKFYYPASGAVGSADIYRLSASNDRSFRIDYDIDGKVARDVVDTSPCECRGCAELPHDT
jgi:hypothetical protein